jgi:hypothetical protein
MRAGPTRVQIFSASQRWTMSLPEAAKNQPQPDRGSQKSCAVRRLLGVDGTCRIANTVGAAVSMLGLMLLGEMPRQAEPSAQACALAVSAASNTSIQCLTGVRVPLCKWVMQPMLALMMVSLFCA